MISVIICTYNRSRLLEKTLNSVAQLRHPPVPWELVIVENNCTDDTAQVVRRFAANAGLSVRYFSETKQGISHARNAGIRGARGDILAMTDDDVILDPQWLCDIHKTFDRFDCLGVGGRIVPLWMSQRPSWLEMDGPRSLMRAVLAFDLGENSCELNDANPPFGANMCFRRSAFEKYGLFRADLGRKYKSLMLGEDTEFCLRLLHSGEKLVYAPGAIVYHAVSEERLRKRYFCSWYFNFGKYRALTSNCAANSIAYYGIPRYLFKDLLLAFVKWPFISDSKQRFRHKLLVYLLLGEISASRSFGGRTFKQTRPPADKSIGVRDKALSPDGSTGA